MRTYTDVFINSDEVEFKFRKLESDYKGTWVLNIDTNSIFMTEEQVKQLASAIGKIYWNLDVPMELVDPGEEYNEQLG
jgi:hypothetical protein